MLKKKNKKRDTKKIKTLDRLISVITKACNNNDWSWYIESKDEIDFLSATISVSKNVGFDEIKALITINILLDGTVQFGIQKTSFYNYGIDALHGIIFNHLKRDGWIKTNEKDESQKDKPLDLLIKIFKRFNLSVIQLSKRHDGRNALLIQDEYDAQDYLHALLKIHFNDIRPEEYSPSYAGSSSKIDFLLKEEKIVVEVKFATPKLSDSKIGEQLIVDMERYKNHPDCEAFVCFVYDPNFNIKNPCGLEKDLSGKKDKLNVNVLVYPK